MYVGALHHFAWTKFHEDILQHEEQHRKQSKIRIYEAGHLLKAGARDADCRIAVAHWQASLSHSYHEREIRSYSSDANDIWGCALWHFFLRVNCHNFESWRKTDTITHGMYVWGWSLHGCRRFVQATCLHQGLTKWELGNRHWWRCHNLRPIFHVECLLGSGSEWLQLKELWGCLFRDIRGIKNIPNLILTLGRHWLHPIRAFSAKCQCARSKVKAEKSYKP